MANFEGFARFHGWLYEASRGWIGAYLGRPMALLYTKGARTGLIRRTPLQYYNLDSAGIVVLASNNGQPKAPAWYFNLKANPEFMVRVGRDLRRVRAEELPPDRRAEVWPAMRRQNPAIDGYQARAGRTIPVILLRTLGR